MVSSYSAKNASECLRRYLILLVRVALILQATSFWALPARAQEATTEPEAKETAGAVQAGPTAEDCVDYHRQAQLSQREGKLLHAKQQLGLCLQPGCSPVLRNACSELMLKLEPLIPSIVPAAQGNGTDLLDVTVREGETILTERLDGVPIPLDPGPHELTFSAEGMKEVQVQVIVRTGEAHRLLKVTLEPVEEEEPSPAPTAKVQSSAARPAHVPSRRTPWLGYALVGSGVAMAGTGVALSLAALFEYNLAREDCMPQCPDSKRASIATKAWVGNGLVAVSVVALTIGTIDLVRTRARNRKVSRESISSESRRFSATLALGPQAILVEGRFP